MEFEKMPEEKGIELSDEARKLIRERDLAYYEANSLRYTMHILESLLISPEQSHGIHRYEMQELTPLQIDDVIDYDNAQIKKKMRSDKEFADGCSLKYTEEITKICKEFASFQEDNVKLRAKLEAQDEKINEYTITIDSLKYKNKKLNSALNDQIEKVEKYKQYISTLTADTTSSDEGIDSGRNDDPMNNDKSAERMSSVYRNMEAEISRQKLTIEYLRTVVDDIPLSQFLSGEYYKRGRPPISEKKKTRILALYNQGRSCREIGFLEGVSKSSVSKIIKESRKKEAKHATNEEE